MRSTVASLLLAVLLAGAAACGDGDEPSEAASSPAPARPRTAFVADVQPTGEDEVVTLASDLEIRSDLGGWYLVVGDVRIPVGIGTQIDPGTQLRVHTGCGEDGPTDVYACLDEPDVLPDDGGRIEVQDSAGTRVTVHRY